MTELQKRLFAMQDEKYRDFSSKLTPNVDKSLFIGVRTPQIRALAKEIKGCSLAAEFLGELPHEYYDENILHGALISDMKDYDACVSAVDAFLPYVNNWAVCDLMSPKVLKKQPERTLENIWRWIASDMPYTTRFGIEMLMSFYLDELFRPEYLEPVAQVRSEEYYVNMMVAWFFATALAKQYDAALPYVEKQLLSKWTHNKTIQKAVESYRITDEQKDYLKSLKIK